VPENENTRRLRELRRYTWLIYQDREFKKRFDLELLPEQYEVDEPARVTVTQTRGRGWVDHFGLGFGTLTLAGTTGWGQLLNANKGSSAADRRDGYERWTDLRDFFRFYHELHGGPGGDNTSMQFCNWTQEDYYEVVPVGLPRLQRSVREPLLYRYTISMHLLGRINQKAYEAERDRLLEQLATDSERAKRIGERMATKLDDQWGVLVRDILHQTTLTQVTDLADLAGLGQVVRDAQLQTFLDTILARNSPANYVPPQDSSMGVVGRTRNLAEKIVAFANGETRFIESTLTEVRAVAQGWRDVLDAVDYAAHIPASYAREARETLCGVQSLLLYPQVFRSSALAAYDTLTALLEDSGCATTIPG
jgi:hypothetical protein